MLDENMIRRVRGQIQAIFSVSVYSNVRGFPCHFFTPKTVSSLGIFHLAGQNELWDVTS